MKQTMENSDGWNFKAENVTVTCYSVASTLSIVSISSSTKKGTFDTNEIRWTNIGWKITLDFLLELELMEVLL